MEQGIDLIAPLFRERGTYVSIHEGSSFSEFHYIIRFNKRLRLIPLGMAIEAFVQDGTAIAALARVNLSSYELGIIENAKRACFAGKVNRLSMERKLKATFYDGDFIAETCLERLAHMYKGLGYCVTEPEPVPDDMLRAHGLSSQTQIVEVCEKLPALLASLEASRPLVTDVPKVIEEK